MPDIDLGSVSIPKITQFLKQADVLGVDYSCMLERSDIPVQALEEPGGRVAGEALQNLLSQLIAAADDPCFGLHSSVFVQPATYSVVGYIALNSANLREVLEHIPLYERIVGNLGVTSIHIEDGTVLQRWDCRFQQEDVRRHLIESALGSWQYYSRNYLNFPPADCVLLEHPAPEVAGDARAMYREIIGCDVKFDQAVSGVQFREKWLELPVPEANTQLLGILLEHATGALREVDVGQRVSVRVRSLLRLTLREGISSREEIAERLGMCGRTLQRQLIKEGTHYQELLNDLRQEMATYHLKNTLLPIETIASRLGYTDVRSFYRCFKQWTGHTPGIVRRQAADANHNLLR